MPFLNTNVLSYLLSRREQAEAVVAHINGLWQTFPAVYDKRLLPFFRAAIEGQHLQIQRVLDQLAISPVYMKDISSIDPDLSTFTNINTPDELKVIQSSHE